MISISTNIILLLNVIYTLSLENKNGRLSLDNLPLCTQDNSVLELFYKDLHLLYDLKNAFEHEGIDNYVLNSSIPDRVKTNSLLHTRN